MITPFTPNHNANARKIVSALRKGQAATPPAIKYDEPVAAAADPDALDNTQTLPTPIQDNSAPSAGNVRYRKKIEQQIRQMREAINAKEWDTALVHSQAITSLLELLEKNPGRAAQKQDL